MAVDERWLLGDIEDDLRAAPARRVMYLEGRTDPKMFFALVGERLPAVSPRQGGYVCQDILVRGLSSEKGSGSLPVRQRVDVASKHRGLLGKVFGIIDGDGRSLSEQLAAPSSPAKPLFRWPTYCIENQLVMAGWPPAWGTCPDWLTEVQALAPYVAVNRLLVRLQRALEPLNFPRHLRPNFDQPLHDVTHIEAVLRDGREHIAGYEINGYRQEVAFVQATLARDAEEMHALVNGKWLVQWAAKRQGLSEEMCRTVWCTHVATLGGGAEAANLWRRVSAYDAVQRETADDTVR